MKFRPCIDIHNGKVKQIVGGSLKDQNNQAAENFVSEQTADFFAELYRGRGLYGGHVILLNPEGSEYYQQTKQQALSALSAFSGGLQAGGGMNPYNAEEFLKAGASHVIVTSYVFKDGQLHKDRLRQMCRAVSKEKLVLDLSCRKKDKDYYIVTDRWQNYTSVPLNKETIEELSDFCDEFLIHAVDVEGKASGIETELVKLLAECSQMPVTYAGGVGSFSHLEQLRQAGNNHVDVTVGSALDIFGGHMELERVLSFCIDSMN